MNEPVMLAPVRVHDLKKGDVIYTRKYHDMGGDKGRPAVVLAAYDGSAVVAYLTAGNPDASPFHIPTKALPKPSTILLHRAASISLDRVMERRGSLTPAEMEQLNNGLSLLYGLA